MNNHNEQYQRFAPIKRRFGDCFVGELPEHDFKRLNTGGSRSEACPATGSTGMKRRFGVVDSSGLVCDGACPRPRKCPRSIGSTTVASSGGFSSNRVSSVTTLSPSPSPPPSSTSSTDSSRDPFSGSSLSSLSSLSSDSSLGSSSSSSDSSSTAFVSSDSDNAVVPGGSRSDNTVVGDHFDVATPSTGTSISFWNARNREDAVSLWIESTLMCVFHEEDSIVPQMG